MEDVRLFSVWQGSHAQANLVGSRVAVRGRARSYVGRLYGFNYDARLLEVSFGGVGLFAYPASQVTMLRRAEDGEPP